MRVKSFVTVSGLALVMALPAAAQDQSFNFALGLGVGAAPEYPGSKTTVAVPVPTFTFGSLNFGGFSTGNGVREIPDSGASVKGAFRFIGDRKAKDSPELAGLEDIDFAVELGLGVAYQQTNWVTFGEVRKGVTGHSGITGTIGADLIMRPNDRLVIKAGPRVNFGNDKFANTYFGVPAGGTANFASYEASGGALGAGVEFKGSYFLDDNWSLEGGLSYEKLLGDAADSPITLNGSDDQWRVSIGLSRQFTLNF